MGPLHPSLSLPAALSVGIPAAHSHVLSLLFTSTYVGSLYLAQLVLSGHTKPAQKVQPRHAPIGLAPASASGIDSDVRPDLAAPSSSEPAVGSRDHPETIRLRLRAVQYATSLSLLGVYYVTKTSGAYTWSGAIRPTLALLGLPASAHDLTGPGILPYALAPVLMLGPLVANWFDRDLPFQRYSPYSTRERCTQFWKGLGLVEVRNYMVGPLTEELVFRSTILSVSILGGLSTRALVFGTPLWFGLAHAHHALDQWKKGGKTRPAAVRAVLGSLFQLGYTTLFGWFAAYLFVRTGSVLPPLVSHVFCNVMGIYLPGSAVARHPEHAPVLWTAYLTGIVGFIFGLRAL